MLILGITVLILCCAAAKYYNIVDVRNLNVRNLNISDVRVLYVVKKLFRGRIPLQTIKDFITFKFRVWVTRNLESGLLKSVDKDFELVYYDGDRRYKIRFSKNRGVRQISRVSTISGENVTSEIIELMGPGLNFYGILSTPRLLGFKEGLDVEYRSGEEVFYHSNDIISLYSPE